MVLESLFSRNRPKNGVKTDVSSRSTVSCRLLSIAVHPDYRGQNIAGEFTKYFFKLLSRDGISRVGLSVHLDNMDAIKFYKKDGWKIECVTHNSIYFFHDFNPEDSTT